MVKVSVILPVYGVAQYIEKCTQSLLAQTLWDMEFIYVDDHGPDNSIELVQKMIEGHARQAQFRFLKPPQNVGAGMARNFAIPQAQGQYIAFVDSDDWIEPTMFEELYNEAMRHDGADLCYCQAAKDYLDGQPTEILKNPDIEAGPLTDDKRRYFLTHYVSLFWTFIYKRDLLMQHDIRYPSSRSADDSYFVTSSLLLAQSTAHVDKPFYHYLIRPGSVCTTKDSNKYQKRLETFRSLMAFLKEKQVYDTYRDEIDYVYLKKGYITSVFNYIYNSLEPKASTLSEIRNEMLQQVPAYRSNPYYRHKCSLRLLVGLLHRCPRLAIRVIRTYLKRTNPVV
ncbi:MAG: glycosyltransferase [Bacteroidales bacterium]|nr:glycosyltransferase [Bacteroidales bacterium]